MNTSIQQIREKLGMPRRLFSEMLGVTYQAIAQYEKGTRLPQLAIAYRIIDLAKKYKVKVSIDDIYKRN